MMFPDLSDCRRLFLRNYTFNTLIGVYAPEKAEQQRITLNVDLFVPLSLSTPVADRLDEVVDYDFIRNTIEASAANTHIHLLETLCDDLARQMLEHPKVRAVRVAVEKPDIYPDCEAVGVEVFRIKESSRFQSRNPI
ncbi:Dihydroneopterin aldolase (DHNA) [Candidatus Glomeribacter gigasporarum BEG34]|uniref:dihydroneopterin aldolase n=1 Tax=Candidatus Glomeribacter gigasporarum BEG34 TaxID=1070319 RepID=G2J7J8_9BURK|nr:Dihydroneopterin aldolase (DHNA) [Candidatus Glomeribacter gigasporarum BEG34]